MPTLTRTATPYTQVRVRHIARGGVVGGVVADTIEVADVGKVLDDLGDAAGA